MSEAPSTGLSKSSANIPHAGRLAGEQGTRVLPAGRYPYLIYWSIEAGEAWIALHPPCFAPPLDSAIPSHQGFGGPPSLGGAGPSHCTAITISAITTPTVAVYSMSRPVMRSAKASIRLGN